MQNEQQIQQTENNQIQLENLDLRAFGDETIKEFIKDSIDKIRDVEKEAMQMFSNIKEQLIVREGNESIKIEDVILTAPIAKDYLLVLSSQSDNRIKLMKTVIDLIKANQAAINFNNNIGDGNNNNSQFVNLISEKLSQVDPFEGRTSSKKKEVFSSEEDENNIPIDAKEKKPIIHSYGFRKNQ